MAEDVRAARRAIDLVRQSRGYHALDADARRTLSENLGIIERALGADAYAQVLDTLDLERRLRGESGAPRDAKPAQPDAARPATPPPPPQTAQIGQRAADVLQAVDFPGFVAALVTGTFQAIVDASAQQIRDYAKLVADITQSLEQYTDEKVTPNQARDQLAGDFPNDLTVVLPAPGRAGTPRLVPRPERVGTSPPWLERFGLGGEELSEELTEGALLEKGRLRVGESRLQTLATMVLMGINRIVVNEGDLRAKLQFHAAARDVQKAEMQQQSAGIAGRAVGSDTGTQMLVSTVRANAQADASIKADLMGEVRVSFRSETFPLERFADTAAIQLLNRHARWREETPPAAGAPAPAPSTPPTTGNGGSST